MSEQDDIEAVRRDFRAWQQMVVHGKAPFVPIPKDFPLGNRDLCDYVVDREFQAYMAGRARRAPGPATAAMVAKAKLYVEGGFHTAPSRELCKAFIAEHEPAESANVE